LKEEIDELAKDKLSLSEEIQNLNKKEIKMSLKEKELRSKGDELMKANLSSNKELQSFGCVNDLIKKNHDLQFKILERDHSVTELNNDLKKKYQTIKALQQLVNCKEEEISCLKKKVGDFSTRQCDFISKVNTVDGLEKTIMNLQFRTRQKSQNEEELKFRLELCRGFQQILQESVSMNERQICGLKTREEELCERERRINDEKGNISKELEDVSKKLENLGSVNELEKIIHDTKMQVERKDATMKELNLEPKQNYETSKVLEHSVNVRKEENSIINDVRSKQILNFVPEMRQKVNMIKELKYELQAIYDDESFFDTLSYDSLNNLIHIANQPPDIIGLSSDIGGWPSSYKPKRSNLWFGKNIRPGGWPSWCKHRKSNSCLNKEIISGIIK